MHLCMHMLQVPVTAHNKSSLEQNIAEVCSLLGRECIDNVLIYGNVVRVALFCMWTLYT